MATYVKKTSGLTIFLVCLVLLLVVGLCIYGYYAYQKLQKGPEKPVTQEDVADIESRLALAEARLDAVDGQAKADFWWTVAKWVLVIGAGTFIIWYWIKRKFDSATNKLTIDAALELGQKHLEKRYMYQTKWCDGGSMQRREGSDDRVLLLWFSMYPRIPGHSGFPSGMMYIAVVNRSWEERHPSEPGMTFVQFINHLHELDVLGFSIQKEEELAGLLKLKEKAEALGNASDLAADLGLGSPQG